MPIELHHLPKIPWKLGNDAVRAKDVAKLNKFFEEIEFDFYFWHETLKVEKNFENIRDFYLQSIKPRLEYELSKQQPFGYFWVQRIGLLNRALYRNWTHVGSNPTTQAKQTYNNKTIVIKLI